MDNQLRTVSDILEEWKGVKVRLEDLFRERNQNNVKVWMEKGISLFIQLLFISNDKQALLTKQIPFHQFVIMPVNLEERMAFIMSRPALYHSYRQLSELMIEQEKLFVKRNIIKKASQPKG